MTRAPTVLVVDDDEFMRTLLVGVFTNVGLGVETFASAQELLDRADLSPPALLLLDVVMPDMTGLELQKILGERQSVIPIVFLTGSSDVPMAVAAMRNGAADFIEKPFESQVLVDRVKLCMWPQRANAVVETAFATSPEADDHAKRLLTLTPREREVHDCMITGKTSKVIARDLGGSFRTIEIHRTRVMAKTATSSLADLVRLSLSAPPRAPNPDR